MPIRHHSVALVVDAAFGDALAPLAQRMPVWIADTAGNRPAIDAIWREHTLGGMDHEVTAFRVSEADTPDRWAADVIPALIEHHGTWSHEPPVSALEVHGADATDALVRVLQAHGFITITPWPGGFTAHP